MSSICYGGSVRMNPEVENENRYPMFDDGYPYSIPKVYIQGCGEVYNRQYAFNWDDDSVVEVRGKQLIKYTKTNFLELLAKDEKGEIVWVDCRSAPYSECWDGEYLDDVRVASEYSVEEYDFDKLEKRRYKVTLDETSKFDVETLYGLFDFLDPELVGSNFVIKDGVLKKYIGKSNNLIIPEGVTKIDYNCFVSVHDFDLILIPKTLVQIPLYTFTDCTAKSIKVDEDNPKYYSKDGCLIDRETGTIVWAFTATSIPEDPSIKEIGHRAFAGRSDIESMVIPDNITKIGLCAFSECLNLVSIVISDSTAIIDPQAFQRCKSLSNVKLPNTLEVVNADTFCGCSSLTSIELPDSVQAVKHYAFYECSSLSEIRSSGTGMDLSEVISGTSFVRNGDEWVIDIPTHGANFSGFVF